MAATALAARGLWADYGEHVVVRGLHLEVACGEIVGLLGPNGAGKTTALACILGTKSPRRGTVEVLGMNPTKDRKTLFERVGVQFQETHYQDKIKVKEICECTSSLYRKPRCWRETLAAFGMEGQENRFVSELSGGERQKLSVALALLPDPELVILDELTTGLDTRARKEMWRHLERLKSQGLTVLLTSHYMDEVEALCDRLCILKQGQMVASGTIEELVEASPYPRLEDAYLWFTGEQEGTVYESL